MNDLWYTETIESLECALDGLKNELISVRKELNDHKEAMIAYMGSGRYFEALEQYKQNK